MLVGSRRNGKTLEILRKQTELLNQAVEDIRMLGRMGCNICAVCANFNGGEGCEKCITCLKDDNWEWRGLVKEEEHNA